MEYVQYFMHKLYWKLDCLLQRIFGLFNVAFNQAIEAPMHCVYVINKDTQTTRMQIEMLILVQIMIIQQQALELVQQRVLCSLML